jgi:hypothetical protein
MKARGFIIAVTAGLACGFLVRPMIAGSRTSFSNDRKDRAPQAKTTKQSASDLGNWDARIFRYLNAQAQSKSTSTGSAANAREEADRLMDLLRQPVDGSSIRRGVAILNASDLSNYGDIMASVFERWAREAPEEALAAAPELFRPEAKSALVWKVFQPLAGDPEIIIKAMAQPPGIIRTAALAAITASAPPDKLDEILRESMLNQSPGFRREDDSIQAQLIRRMATIDPELPMRLAQGTTDPQWRTELLRSVLATGIEAADPKLLADMVRDPQNAEALKDSFGQTLQRNPAEGIKLMAHLPEADRQEVLSSIVGWSIWGFAKLGDSQIRTSFDNDRFEILRKDIEQQHGVDGFRAILADSALNTGTEGLANAAKWLGSRNDPAGLADLTRRATRSEPFTTARWLATLPASGERDRAVAVFAETHAAADPESAAAWAESITDPSRREATLAAIKKNTAE